MKPHKSKNEEIADSVIKNLLRLNTEKAKVLLNGFLCDLEKEIADIKKTNWTPLTSQEQLDKVWESMEVGERIVVINPLRKDFVKPKERKRFINLDFVTFNGDKYTILTGE